MHKENYDTLSEAINGLTNEGFKDGFKTEDGKIVGNMTSKKYLPEELKIVRTHDLKE